MSAQPATSTLHRVGKTHRSSARTALRIEKHMQIAPLGVQSDIAARRACSRRLMERKASARLGPNLVSNRTVRHRSELFSSICDAHAAIQGGIELFSSIPEACLELLGPAPSPRRHPDEIVRTLGVTCCAQCAFFDTLAHIAMSASEGKAGALVADDA